LPSLFRVCFCTHICAVTYCTWRRLFSHGQLVQSASWVNCCWPSPLELILFSVAFGINNHNFVLFKDSTCFEMGLSLQWEKGFNYYWSSTTLPTPTPTCMHAPPPAVLFSPWVCNCCYMHNKFEKFTDCAQVSTTFGGLWNSLQGGGNPNVNILSAQEECWPSDLPFLLIFLAWQHFIEKDLRRE
jgi:hypothetical protein